jgi:hypothetical protein
MDLFTKLIAYSFCFFLSTACAVLILLVLVFCWVHFISEFV